MKKPFLLFLLIMLPGCVGGTFGNHKEIEEYPLRGATQEEGARLKRCLRAALRAQENYRRKNGKYTSHLRELQVDDDCQDFKLAQKRTQTGYEIAAQFNEGESTVIWSITDKGVIEEHLDPDAGTDLDLEF